MAAARQENRKKLLGYRGQLVNALFAELEENLAVYVDTPAYVDGVVKTMLCHQADVQPGCVVQVRPQDLARLQPALEKALPGCQVQADREIRFGGAKLRTGRRLFDRCV